MEHNQSSDQAVKLLLPSLTLRERDVVAVITFDQKDKTVNTLSSQLMPQFEEVIAYIQKSTAIKAIVLISGKKDNFIAGADIEELKSAQSEEEVKELSRKGQEFYNRLEQLPQPVIAAIHGTCLGGGLELALACDYRIATDSPKTVLGLPEVMLGLLPGAGGTQRLPRLIGLEKALDMMLTGKQLKARKALKIGLVDHVAYPDGLEDVAVAAAKRLGDKTMVIKRQRSREPLALVEKTKVGRKFILQQAQKQVHRKTRGLYPAPDAILETVGYGLEHGMEKGLLQEAEEFARLSQTPQFKGLVSLYFAQTELKKNRFGEPKTKVRNIGVLGAGLMGAGIALISVQKGFQVRVKDVSQENLGKGKKYVWDALNQRVQRKSFSKFEAEQFMSHLYTQLDTKQLDNCELIIEAVFEDLNLKHKVLQEIEEATSDKTIFASNTSALPISKIAEASKRPENVLGMHYFSPVHKMPLLEVITTDKTSNEAAALAVDVGIRQGKTVIVVKDGPGFYTTRILAPFMDEAAILALEGVDFYSLDEAMQEFGYPVGPITLIDEVGLDVAYHVGKDLGLALGKRISSNDPQLLMEFINKDSLGRKSRRGFYVYDNKRPKSLLERLTSQRKKKKQVNPIAEDLILKHGTATPKPIDIEDIQKRMCYRMLNEAAYCLQEEILARPLDGDIGAVFGLGFPPFHGGPFRYIDSHGAQNIIDDLKRYQELYGERFTPCPMLVDMANSAKKFYES